jgi:hypothetical protein
MCHLSGDDLASSGSQPLTAMIGGTYYQKSPCLDCELLVLMRHTPWNNKQVKCAIFVGLIFSVSLTCTADSMTVHLQTGDPFEGRIYSQEHPTGSCEVFGSGQRKTEIAFGLQDSNCGVSEEDKGVYTNVIVVQHHPVIQRKGDKAVKLFCLFETSNKTVSSSLALSPE